MATSTTPSLNRRQFVAAAAAIAVTTAASTAHAGGYEGISGTTGILTEPVDDDQITETYTADIIIVGGGMSGMCTGCRATELGANVIVVSASSLPISRGGSNCGFGTAYQADQGVSCTKDDIARILRTNLYVNGFGVNHELWNRWIDNSAESFDWMCGIMAAKGLQPYLEPAEADPANMVTVPAHSHDFWNEENPIGGNTGAPLQAQAYADCILENGGTIHYNTRAVQLVRDEDGAGRVCAVIAQNPNGELVKYVANKAIVLATGDFSKNPELMEKYAPEAYAKYKDRIDFTTVDYDVPFSWTGLYPGEGHLMALQAGAAWQKTQPCAVMEACFANSSRWPTGKNGEQPICLNANGKRFMAETPSSAFLARMLPHVPGKKLFFVWDRSFADIQDAWGGWGIVVNEVNGIPHLTSAEQAAAWDEAVEADTLVKADTLEELFAQLEGIDTEAALTSVEAWNGYAEAGHDDEFCVNPTALVPVKEGPFYAATLTEKGYSFLTVLGGIRTDADLRVCDEADEPIEGLYCTGTMIGDFFANMYTFSFAGQNLGATCCTLSYLLGNKLAEL